MGDSTTIPDLLRQAGWSIHRWNGHRGRARCPVHRGDNPSAFSFTEWGWNCWVCGAHGGPYELLVALGLAQPRAHKGAPRGAPPHLGGVDPTIFAQSAPPLTLRMRPSQRLAAALEAHRQARRAVWTALHQRAVRHLAAAELVLAHVFDDEDDEEVQFQIAAALAGPAYGWLDRADAALGCDCRHRAA